VVVNGRSALPEVVARAGVAADEDGGPGALSFAAAVQDLLARPQADRERRARARAEEFGWPAAVNGFLTAHHVPGPVAAVARGAEVSR
jgi:alpha-1,6-mannosyltransferase